MIPLLLAAAAAAAAAPELLHSYSDLVLSPDAARLAAVEQAKPVGSLDTAHGVVVVRDARTGAVLQRIDPCADCRYSGLTWSASGRVLVMVASNTQAGKAAIEAATDAGVSTLTTIDGLAAKPRFSPDGRTLSFLGVIGAHKQVGATQAGEAQVGEIGSVVDEQRIMVIPATGGAPRAVSPADTWVYEYDWTPDGRSFVATAATGDGDNNWWIAKLIQIDAGSGAIRVIAAPDLQMNDPRVSPDGKSVAFIGGLMSDFGSVGGDVYVAPIAGGGPRDVTPGYKGTFTSLTWRGETIRATALIGAENGMTAVDPATGRVSVLSKAPVEIGAGDGEVSLSADGRTAAMVVQDFRTAPHVVVQDGSGARTLTHDNDALPRFGEARSVTWTNGGFDVQGWLLAPTTVTPGKRYPMVTVIHGGPAAASTPAYTASGPERELLDHGYYVFLPNPRGSYGQGEAFTRANVQDFGGGDLKDVLAGIDAVEKLAPIDDAKLGVFGHSYGGYMTMWIVTHTDRFKAAVAGAGIANWSSYYGENGIDQWMVPYFGSTFYDDPTVYDRLSPIRSIKAAKTPTFIYVGERDVECPAAQSLEFWHGLTAMGVPNSLVIYKGEGHGIRKPENQIDRRDRTLAWFDKYLAR